MISRLQKKFPIHMSFLNSSVLFRNSCWRFTHRLLTSTSNSASIITFPFKPSHLLSWLKMLQSFSHEVRDFRVTLEPHSLPLSLQVKWPLSVSPFLPPISFSSHPSPPLQFGCLESLTKTIIIMLSSSMNLSLQTTVFLHESLLVCFYIFFFSF